MANKSSEEQEKPDIFERAVNKVTETAKKFANSDFVNTVKKSVGDQIESNTGGKKQEESNTASSGVSKKDPMLDMLDSLSNSVNRINGAITGLIKGTLKASVNLMDKGIDAMDEKIDDLIERFNSDKPSQKNNTAPPNPIGTSPSSNTTSVAEPDSLGRSQSNTTRQSGAQMQPMASTINRPSADLEMTPTNIGVAPTPANRPGDLEVEENKQPGVRNN